MTDPTVFINRLEAFARHIKYLLEEARRDGDASEVARLFKQLRTVHQAIADEQRYYGDRWGDGGVSYG